MSSRQTLLLILNNWLVADKILNFMLKINAAYKASASGYRLMYSTDVYKNPVV